MVSFLVGLEEKKRNEFLKYLDKLHLNEESEDFIKSFNEKINKELMFKRLPDNEIFGIGFRKVTKHLGDNLKGQEGLTDVSDLFSLRGGTKKNHISESSINMLYTPSEVFKKEKSNSFFGGTIDIYKSKLKRIILFKGNENDKSRFVDFINELKNDKNKYPLLNESEINFFNDLDTELSELLNEWYLNLKSFKENSSDILLELDKDNNGQLDFIEGGDDYLPLLKKHQSKIVEIDRTYIQQFIKVSNYLTQKKQNLQVIFERLKDSVNQSQLDELGEILKQEIHTYNIILLNSLHMINSLVEDDMITFYDIYEKFDKLNMFTSNWENQVTEKLDEVNLNLVELMKELRDVGDRIVGSIDNLSYITEESTRQLTSKMEEIDSTLKVGNLINVIQTYQMYKVNKNTKSLRE